LSDLISKLAENEYLVLELYLIFAKNFPEHEKFWETIAAEEQKHCQLLDGFYDDILAQKAEVNEKVFSIKAVNDSIGHIKALIAETGKLNSGLTMKRAVAEAMNIENSMIELKFFTTIISKDDATAQKLKKIEADTKNHYASLKEMNARLK